MFTLRIFTRAVAEERLSKRVKILLFMAQFYQYISYYIIDCWTYA